MFKKQNTKKEIYFVDNDGETQTNENDKPLTRL